MAHFSLLKSIFVIPIITKPSPFMNIRILPLALAMGFSASVAIAQQSVRTAQPLPYLRGTDASLEQHDRPVSPSATPENTIIFQDDFLQGHLPGPIKDLRV